MTPGDLAAYRPVIRQPVKGSYRGYEIVSMPPPSSGGVHLIEILNILEGFDLASMGAGSAQALHTLAEAMKRLCRPGHLARRPVSFGGAGAGPHRQGYAETCAPPSTPLAPARPTR